ncbi:MAG TPA: uroporphyrinogen-III synthase, partial [Chitinophagaceae bacterium]
MQTKPVTILSTTTLDEADIAAGRAAGLAIDVIPFIEVVLIDGPVIAEEVTHVAGMPATVIFTSIHAVRSVQRFVRGPVQWKMFCVGEITAGAAISAFPGSTLLDTAATAGELANRIVASGTGDSAGITFFCGDHRRDELPSMVRSGGSTMKEIVAYQTIKTPHVIDNDYDGGIFFSPSAVQSFFSVNDARRAR